MRDSSFLKISLIVKNITQLVLTHTSISDSFLHFFLLCSVKKSGSVKNLGLQQPGQPGGDVQ